jgi:hypothetical protein
VSFEKIRVGKIAAHYIKTQNFEDMKKLTDKEHCDKLVILTSKILANSLSNLEVEYLAQQLKGNQEVNEISKEKILYLNKDSLPKLDVQNKTQKQRLCIGIAKHYVQVAHVFAAIQSTINPVFTHKNESGQEVSSTLENKDKIPENATIDFKTKNLCSNRINILINNNPNFISSTDDDTPIVVQPKFCNINNDSSKTRKLDSEPGIPELEQLYYDKYNYETGEFTEMTDNMRKNVYEKDVETFYKVFSGRESIPTDSITNKKTITTFSQIPLKDFHNSEGCKQPDGVYTKSYSGSLKEKLFKKYADNVKNMMITTTTNQKKLIAIIGKLFVTANDEIIVNPELNDNSMKEIIATTRNIIIDLYKSCENDFLKGLEIFEAIVQKNVIDTGKDQIKNLEASIENEMDEEPIVVEENARPSETFSIPSETFAIPSETFARPSETFARPSETFARPSETFARPSEFDLDVEPSENITFAPAKPFAPNASFSPDPFAPEPAKPSALALAKPSALALAKPSALALAPAPFAPAPFEPAPDKPASFASNLGGSRKKNRRSNKKTRRR